MNYLLAAYFAAWLIIFLYLTRLEGKVASLKRDLDRIKGGVKGGEE